MQKISRGRGFRGALNYAFDRDSADAEPGRLLGGNMSGQDARQLAAEFGQVRRLRPDIERPVWHNALRLKSGETLTDAQWVAIADDYMKRMGFSEFHPRAYVLHDDADGQHIHIVASRVSTEGKVYVGKNENLASTRHIQALERDHGLTITKGPTYDPDTNKVVMPEARRLKAGEVEQAIRTGAEPPRQKLQRLIDAAKADRPTAAEFARRLTVAGVGVRANVASTGRLNGFSFELDGVKFKASQLGDKYKWNQLQKEISYDQTRDRAGLEGRQPARHPGQPHAKQQQRAGAGVGVGGTAAPEREFTTWRDDCGSDRSGLRASRRIRPERMPPLRQPSVGDGQQEVRDAVLSAHVPRYPSDHQILHSVPVGGGLYAVEVLDRRQVYKARLLQERYQQEIKTALAARLAYVDRQPDRIAITLKGGGRVTDYGDRLLTKSGRDQEILAAVALAKAKGWKTIHLMGSADFKARAWLEIARAGLQVTGYEPSPNLRAQLAKEKVMLGTPGGASLTPDVAPDTQANAASRRWGDALRKAKNSLEAARQSASALSLFEYDQQRKKVAAWLDEVEQRGVNDDLLWQIGHHQVGDGKKAPDAAKAALEPLYQLRQGEIDGRKQAAELARQEQIQRELMAQTKADELLDLLNKPGLSAAQEVALQQQLRYYTALAAGYGEAEARERSANPNAAPRPR